MNRFVDLEVASSTLLEILKTFKPSGSVERETAQMICGMPIDELKQLYSGNAPGQCGGSFQNFVDEFLFPKDSKVNKGSGANASKVNEAIICLIFYSI